jgi:hypothetical protein
MQRSDTQWPPGVGDLVYVIETGDLGEVMSIERSGDDPRFMVDLYPQAGGLEECSLRLGRGGPGSATQAHAGRVDAPYSDTWTVAAQQSLE